jgi:enamine deaminase RidA (YjgF/YER057c/UK114 family)
MLELTPIQSPAVPAFELDGVPVHGSSAVLVRGDFALLYTSGLVAPAAAAGRGELEAQVRAVLEALRALVRAAGGELEHVVKLTAWLPHRADIARYAAVRREYFPRSAPASTTVVCELVEPDMLIELEAVAAIPAPPAR